MTTAAAYSVCVHGTLYEVVALHPIFVRTSVCKMSEALLAKLVLFELPEIFQIHTDLKADRPVVVFSVDWICGWLPLRVALHAHVCGLHGVEPRGIHDVGLRWPSDMLRAGAMTFFAAHIPLRNGIGLDIEIYGMTSVA